MSKESSEQQYLHLVGVQENNLKNLSLSLKHDSVIVISGVSGSGKSTLAIDTIYAEGGRRYIETFSPYTRQFLDRLQQPKLTSMTGVRPALALEQRNRMTSSRSTVGTVTEVNDYLKVIWSNLAETRCPTCDTPVQHDTPMRTFLALNVEIVPQASLKYLLLTFPLPLSGQATGDSLGKTLQAEGFTRVFLRKGSQVLKIEDLDFSTLKGEDGKELLIVVDRVLPGEADQETEFRERVLSGINQAFTYGHGRLIAVMISDSEEKPARFLSFNEALVCNSCGKHLSPPRSYMFSFNSPLGACPTCRGFGKTLSLDPDLCVPNPSLTLREGAIAPWATPSTTAEFKKLRAFCESASIDLDTPWQNLTKKATDQVFGGASDKKKFPGLRKWFERLEGKRHKMHVRIFLSRYRSEGSCPDCHGTRLKPIALSFRVGGITLPELWAKPLEHALSFFRELQSSREHERLVDIALDEVISRVAYMQDIGLGYLTLDRQSRTLSGGESQRVNLTSILGSRLMNTLLVLDEPTIGLHQRDTYRLIEAVRALQERGNTVIMVEHDPEVILAADEVVELGPKAGNKGGEIVYQGSAAGLAKCAGSATGRYFLAQEKEQKLPPRSKPNVGSLIVQGARANNLKSIDVEIPLGGFVVLTGVSDSGKSSLLRACIAEPYAKIRQGVSLKQLLKGDSIPVSGFQGLENIDDIIFIDQSPIGKTPRSNPATYTKAWDEIREALAETPDAQKLGLSKSAFSFNVDGGRCPVCSGAGYIRIEMQFLADVFVQCEACNGSRFQDSVLGVRFAGKNVVELLDMTLEDVVSLFESLGEDVRATKVRALLQPLLDLGLGYLRLGHPLSVVSGGEAQRIKIASYLQGSATGKYLFILDEPTTGLHPENITQLLQALRKLIAQGHTVLCVEHNLDVIRQADWIVDMGPDAGERGGEVVATGSPYELFLHQENYPKSQTVSLLNVVPVSKKAEILPLETRSKRKSDAPTPLREIEILGARHHNLKNISVTIPQHTLTVVTGVSGSGKSTFAFDIVFAEGQRRYIDCLSPYARQFMKQLDRAEVDRVANLPPTIAISQKTSPPMGVSTVGTTTETYQFLRLLFSKVGIQHCPKDDTPISSFSPALIADEIAARFKGQRVYVLAPMVSGRKGYYNDLFQRAVRAELTEARIDGKMTKIDADLRLERHKLHWISLVVGSLAAPEKNRRLLQEAVEQALLLGSGTIEIIAGDKHNEPELLSTARVCPKCKTGYRELDPQDFSFRSNRGVCGSCGGRGTVEKRGGESTCPECDGGRIASIGRHVRIQGQRIFDLSQLKAPALLKFMQNWDYEKRLEPIVEPILRELKSRLEVIMAVGLDYLSLDRDASTLSGGEAQRLRLARALGSPLTGVCYVLDEPSIGLHPQDQGMLMSTLFSLRDAGNTVVVVEHDEETIRAADHIIDIGPVGGSGGGHLVATGTVHDIEASLESATGTALRARSEHRIRDAGVVRARSESKRKKLQEATWLELRGATANNLRSVDVKLPLGSLSVVAGVSGAGKSSLVHGSLVPAVISAITGSRKSATGKRTWDELRNAEGIDRLIEIDQSPVGKTSTSSPASFIGIFDAVRKLYAALPDARTRGWSASHFSFNTGKGRCPECGGRGVIRVPMSFLPDATTLCEACQGMRYNEETLSLLYQGISIGELLKKTMSEAREILSNHRLIRRSLEYVHELGLGYLTLGQPTHTLSGGEAQRLKIAKELGLREAENTLYILDEPTVGLHMVDVDKLMRVLRQLVDKGNTVLVIEHNLDVLREADYLIEVGPGPGDAGGNILFSAPPEDYAQHKGPSPTRTFMLEPVAEMVRVQSKRK